jgi:PD-(D/E)XK nuclease superfamily
MNSSFSTKLPTLQLALDATSITIFKDCPRKYYYSMILGKVTREQNIHLEFGIFYHEGLEFYQRQKASGLDHRAAQIAMTRHILERTWVHPGKPWFTGDSYKNRLTLLRSLIWHTDQYKDEDFVTIELNSKPALELSFSFQTDCQSISTGEFFSLCGHIDRIGSINGLVFGLDYKTTKYNVTEPNYFTFYSPDNQMSLYSFAGKIIYKVELQGMIVDAAQIQVNGTRFKRGFAHRTDSQINEWYKELTTHWISLIDHAAESNQYPMNDTACGRYGGCPYRSICSKGPEIREDWLNSAFKSRVWDPLQVRGDI